MKPLRHSLLVLFFVVSFAIFLGCNPSPVGITVVDDSGSVLESHSLALNPMGVPYIAYGAAGASDPILKEAIFDLGLQKFRQSTIDTEHALRGGCSSAIATAQKRMVSYRGDPNNSLFYGELTSGAGWVIETVDMGWPSPVQTSLALNPSDHNPAIAYGVELANIYAYKAEGTWNYEQFSPSSFASIELAFDPTTHEPGIGIDRSPLGGIEYYARDGSGRWTGYDVDPEGERVSLAFDSHGSVNISYMNSKDGSLWCATSTDGGQKWALEQVDKAESGYSDISIDASGTRKIAYYCRAAGELRLAVNDGSGWVISTVDTRIEETETHHCRPSLALDPDGRVRISYTDPANGSLKFYAEEGAPQVWTAGGAEAEAATYGRGTAERSRPANGLGLLALPVALVLIWKLSRKG